MLTTTLVQVKRHPGSRRSKLIWYASRHRTRSTPSQVVRYANIRAIYPCKSVQVAMLFLSTFQHFLGGGMYAKSGFGSGRVIFKL